MLYVVQWNPAYKNLELKNLLGSHFQSRRLLDKNVLRISKQVNVFWTKSYKSKIISFSQSNENDTEPWL